MDVNGFSLHLKTAMNNLNEKELAWSILSEIDEGNANQVERSGQNLEYITIDALSEQLINFESWKDLGNPESRLNQLLNNTCQYGEQKDVLDIKRLRYLAILWCEGNDQERMRELYDLVQ